MPPLETEAFPIRRAAQAWLAGSRKSRHTLFILVGLGTCLLVPVASFERSVLDLFPHADKIAHGLIFAVATQLVLHMLPKHARSVVVSMILVGGATEALQGLTEYRDASLGDWAADSIGVLSGWFVRSKSSSVTAARGQGDHLSQKGGESAARSHRRSKHAGISLYTLLAAVVALGVIGSVTVTQFTGNRTKIQSVNDIARGLLQAAKRYHLDTGCYPTNIMALIENQASAELNSCGRQIAESRWQGPYISSTETVPRSQGNSGTSRAASRSNPTLPLPNLGPSAKANVYIASRGPAVWIGNLPKPLYQQIGSGFPGPWTRGDNDRRIEVYYGTK